LTPERNAPCPCGSGKKYKKCCGANAAPAQNETDWISLNRAIAYSGAIGKKRETFCLEYTTLKQSKLLGMENKLKQEVSASGKAISCSRGCKHCCSLFVVASLQECECIVHYLYRHNNVLVPFLQSFDEWREKILRIERTFRKLNNLHEKITSGTASSEERQLFDDECGVYARQDIPCPFLVDSACSIYEVRPYVCASIVSVSPSDWCSPAHVMNSQAQHFKVTMQMEGDMPYFARPKSNSTFSSMPFLVYRILQEGYSVLSLIPGLENLKSIAENDPEVRAIIENNSTPHTSNYRMTP
jgi:Fe-S-cluster containining protein